MLNALKKVINKVGYFLLFSHLWLGLCAGIFTLGSFLLIQSTPDVTYILFTITGTVCIYTIHRFYNFQLQREGNSFIKKTGIAYNKVKSTLLILLIINGLIASISFFTLHANTQWILIGPILISIVYVIPLFNNKRLKDFPLVKIFAIALSWTCITLVGPMSASPGWWEESGNWFLVAEHILFLFAMAIPFDIRDEIIDSEMDIKTIPTIIGINNSQYLGLFCLFGAAACLKSATDKLAIPGAIAESLILVYMILGFLIIQSKKNHSELFYLLFLDGILFLYGGIIWINTVI